jgi:diguanylate cyclase (GGDEF)-like protein
VILGRRRKANKTREDSPPDASSEPQPEEPSGDSVEHLLDVLAALLHTWGEFAIELDSMDEAAVREHFEGWARHVLVVAPPPGSAVSATAAGPQQRDWPGLQEFARDHRKSEQAHVRHSLADLREVIWTFLETVGRAIQEDRKTDKRMTSQMGKLREAVGSGDTQAVKKEALRSITLIESLIEVRGERQRSQAEQMASRLDQLNLELVDVREKLATDPLTGIPNRAALDEHLRRLIDVQSIVDVCATLFMIDVDHFKWVNDRYGHPAGDAVLKEVARALQKGFRRKGDFVARFGGDEFVAIVRDAPSDGVRRICEQVLFSIRDMETPIDGELIRVSVSIGAVSFRQGDDVHGWLERADRALYTAKETGRDRFVLPDDETDQAPEPAS